MLKPTLFAAATALGLMTGAAVAGETFDIAKQSCLTQL